MLFTALSPGALTGHSTAVNFAGWCFCVGAEGISHRVVIRSLLPSASAPTWLRDAESGVDGGPGLDPGRDGGGAVAVVAGPVKAVAIPKSGGGSRVLGVPTVDDRIAQTVAAMYLERKVEPIFHRSSTATLMATDRAGPRWTRWRYAGSAVGGTTG